MSDLGSDNKADCFAFRNVLLHFRYQPFWFIRRLGATGRVKFVIINV